MLRLLKTLRVTGTRFGGVILLASVLWSATANAVPVLQGPTNAATGITGLVVGIDIYDVTFSNWGSFNARGEIPPTFLGDEIGAAAATAAIASVLNGTVTQVTNLLISSANFIYVPYFLAPDGSESFARRVENKPGGSTSWVAEGSGVGFDTSSNFGNVSWTSFTIAPIPEPSTVLLLGTGLVGLVGYTRRRKAA